MKRIIYILAVACVAIALWQLLSFRAPPIEPEFVTLNNVKVMEFSHAPRTRDLPIILFSPAWSGRAEDNFFVCEHLARAGFRVMLMPAEAPAMEPDFSTAAGYEVFLSYAQRELERRTGAAEQVLEAMRSHPEEYGGKIGAAGYSFGGAVAAELCRRRADIEAGADVDGTLFGEAAKSGADKPFLFITNTETSPSAALFGNTPEGRRAEFTARSFADMERWLAAHGGWLLRIEGASHEQFSNEGLKRFRSRRFARSVLKKTAEALAAFFTGVLVDGDPATRMEAMGVTRFP